MGENAGGAGVNWGTLELGHSVKWCQHRFSLDNAPCAFEVVLVFKFCYILVLWFWVQLEIRILFPVCALAA